MTGLLDGEGIRSGFLKVFQYCCSGVNLVDGSDGSLTCCRGRTGAAMVAGVEKVGGVAGFIERRCPSACRGFGGLDVFW